MQATGVQITKRQWQQTMLGRRFAHRAFWYSLSVIVAMHVIRPDVSVLSQGISAYGRGPWAWLMASGFVGMGVGLASLAFALSASTGRASRTSAALALTGAIFAVFIAVFPTDLEGGMVTFKGKMHQLMALGAFVCTSMLALRLAWRIPSNDTLRPVMQALAVFLTVEVVSYVVVFQLGATFDGLVERVPIGALHAWYLLATRASRWL